MSTDLLFELDTSGEPDRRSSRIFYNSIGSLDDNDANTSKPSQERPAILKTKTKRYHEQDNMKKFQPGKITKGLRKALGLGHHEIPDHIYRMRQLGYPPGWLKKAEVKKDSITIIGANNSVINPTEDQKRVKYDWDKLHEYPGFNSYNNYDERYDLYLEKGYWPMQEDCLLQNFRNFLSDCQMLGKEATDMSQIRSTTRKSTTDFNLPSTPAIKRKQVDCITPEIENKRTKLSEPEDLSDGEIDDSMDLCSFEESFTSDVVENSITEPIHVETENLDTEKPEIDDEPVREPEQGTVLIVSPAMKKPSLDKFSEGINDHRLFENLPNVGGTYQKVKDVLKKVRL